MSRTRKLNRIPVVLKKIEEIWRVHPDMRLGQLVENLAMWSDPSQNSAWVLEDKDLIKEVDRHLRNRKKIIEAESSPPSTKKRRRTTGKSRPPR